VPIRGGEQVGRRHLAEPAAARHAARQLVELGRKIPLGEQALAADVVQRAAADAFEVDEERLVDRPVGMAGDEVVHAAGADLLRSRPY
jgi:hypothetical protein